MINIKVIHNKSEDKINLSIYLNNKLIQERLFENKNDSYLFSEGFGEGLRAAESIIEERQMRKMQSQSI